ncbi:MAG: hypothetical protein ACRDQW_16405, partial [Haloechinothrix sp.]
MTTWRTAAGLRAFGLVTLASLLALTACGGATEGVASAGGEANPATSEDAEAMDADAQALAFAECMREEGIDIPDPGPDQEGLS